MVHPFRKRVQEQQLQTYIYIYIYIYISGISCHVLTSLGAAALTWAWDPLLRCGGGLEIALRARDARSFRSSPVRLVESAVGLCEHFLWIVWIVSANELLSRLRVGNCSSCCLSTETYIYIYIYIYSGGFGTCSQPTQEWPTHLSQFALCGVGRAGRNLTTYTLLP